MEKENSTKLNEEPVGGSGAKSPGTLNDSKEGGKGAEGSNGLNEEPAGGKDNGVKKMF